MRALDQKLWFGFETLGLSYYLNNADNPLVDLSALALRLSSFVATMGGGAVRSHHKELLRIASKAIEANHAQAEAPRLIALAHLADALETSGVALEPAPRALLAQAIGRCVKPAVGLGADHWSLALGALAFEVPLAEQVVLATQSTPHPDASAYSYARDFERCLEVFSRADAAESERVEVYERILEDFTIGLEDDEPQQFTKAGVVLLVSRLRWRGPIPLGEVADRFAADLREFVGLT